MPRSTPSAPWTILREDSGRAPSNASLLLLYCICEQGFRFWDTAYASTLTVVVLAVLVVPGLGQFFLLDRRIHYR